MIANPNRITSAKITTFKTALYNGLDYDTLKTDHAESYNWQFRQPKASDITLMIGVYDDDGVYYGEMDVDFVVCKCTCGHKTGVLWNADENSAMNQIICGHCEQTSDDDLIVDDTVKWNRWNRDIKP